MCEAIVSILQVAFLCIALPSRAPCLRECVRVAEFRCTFAQTKTTSACTMQTYERELVRLQCLCLIQTSLDSGRGVLEGGLARGLAAPLNKDGEKEVIGEDMGGDRVGVAEIKMWARRLQHAGHKTN